MKPLVGIIMGSTSDWETMQSAADLLDKLSIPHEVRVVSAHRTPDLLFEYASTARERGLEVIIAGAGGAAHLPGMTASKTSLTVLGVPVQSKTLGGLDSLLSIVQMPAGVPVATVSVGGARNAGLLAVRILAASDAGLAEQMAGFQSDLAKSARAKDIAAGAVLICAGLASAFHCTVITWITVFGVASAANNPADSNIVAVNTT